MRPQWIAAFSIVILSCLPAAAQQPSLVTQNDKVSYGIGVGLGRTLKAQGVEVNLALVLEGLRQSLAGETLLLSDEELGATMSAFQQELREKQAQAWSAAAEANQQAGQAFLAANASQEGVVTLPSGLQYKILTPGEGKKPTEDDTVVCHYRGTLIDGTEFDTSYGGEPATFEVRQLIAGFKEALQLMPVGSRMQFFIPSELAYGERGAGDVIGPNSTLIFEIELLSIRGQQ